MASRRGDRMRACAECDLVVQMPVLAPGEMARCPRCTHVLRKRPSIPLQAEAANCLAALIMLAASLSFIFVSFDLGGGHYQIHLFEASLGLLLVDYPVLAVVVALAIIVIPAAYLLIVAYVHLGLLASTHLPLGQSLTRLLHRLEPWMMADVFLVAVLVAMIKIAADADVQLGLSFWAYVGFVILLIRTIGEVNFDALWFRVAGDLLPAPDAKPGLEASAQNVLPCHCCGQLQHDPGPGAHFCARCGSRLSSLSRNHLQTTWALLLAAAIFYVPANSYVIMATTQLGDTQAATILGGVIKLWMNGSEPIAVIIFIASIVVPIIKMLALAWLCIIAGKPGLASPLLQHRLYRVTEFIGRWSMVDIFVVAVLVGLVQRGNILSVLPGPAAIAFCAVVILTMLAARSFDPRALWRHTSSPTPMNPSPNA